MTTLATVLGAWFTLSLALALVVTLASLTRKDR